MSISKTILVCFVSVMFVFAESCASDDSSKKVEKTETGDKKSVKTEKVIQEVKVLAEQTTCPIMGGAINKDLYVDKDGKRIYMCCAGCTYEITNNFEEMIKKLEENGEKPETL